jgi:hypothetical protein
MRMTQAGPALPAGLDPFSRLDGCIPLPTNSTSKLEDLGLEPNTGGDRPLEKWKEQEGSGLDMETVSSNT